jgi:hypothetical protein
MNKCDVCGRETKTYVAASVFGGVSFGYCKECLEKGAEPYSAMVSYIACAGRFPEDINPQYQAYCRHVLAALNISEEQFIKDVEQEIKDDM